MPGRVFNTLVKLTDTFIVPTLPPQPEPPAESSLSALLSFESIKSQIYDGSGNFKLSTNVDVSGIVVPDSIKVEFQAALVKYQAWVSEQLAYQEAAATQILVEQPTPQNGSPVIHTIRISDAARSSWYTTDFLRHIEADFSKNWNASENPLRVYADASGMASTVSYRLPYQGAKASNTTVTRFSQFVSCELGASVVISPTLLSSTFISALMSAMFNTLTQKPTEMGDNAFSQFVNATVGDKTNILIRDVFVDTGVKITPYASVNPITLGDFIVELIVVD